MQPAIHNVRATSIVNVAPTERMTSGRR